MSWSSGKDSAMALYELLKNQDFEVVGLLTTVTADYDRISMHGVRRVLLEQQAESIGLPLEKVMITKDTNYEEYGNIMSQALQKYSDMGVTHVAFGDLFLEDLRQYREEKLALVGLKGMFPIWKRDTTELSRTFIDLGFKSVITCVDTQHLDGSFVGRLYDRQLLSELPSSVDPCGENGEFHSFAFDGPIFKHPVKHTLGEIVLRDNRFNFCDVIPQETDS
jgi:uncharacterized protein (TIGR00290 family)